MNIFSNILSHPKTSIAGVLIAATTVAGVLSQQGITLGKAGTGTVVALIGAIAAALLGLLSKDPGVGDSSGNSSSIPSGTKSLGVLFAIAMLAGGACLALTGCPSTTAVHKASVAAAGVGTSLSEAATLNHQLIQAGTESAAEGAQIASLIDQAALANDAFVNTLESIPDTGAQISAAQALNAFNTLQQQIANLNTEGVLHLKSAAAQAKFATVMTSIQGGITAIEVVIAAQSQSKLPPGAPLAPLALPLLGFAGLVLTPEELDVLISLALAAGSDLVTKLMQMKGETTAQLESSALASDAAAEQQAEADEKQ